MPNFPFQRAKALGYALFENFPSAHANIIDANAAQAADGLVWTDVAAFRNWGLSQTVANTGNGLFYNSVEGIWVAVGVFSSNPICRYLAGASGVFRNSSAVSSPSNMTVRKRACDFNPAANVSLMGGLPAASSNKKYMIGTAPGLFTMASTASSQTNTNAVGCLKWFAAAGLWVAGHEGNGAIETSPDGITFTNRTTPNTNPRACLAVGPVNGANGGLVMTSTSSTNKLVHSVDGINWVERTLPATKVWNNVVYVPLLGLYVAMADGMSGTAVASSVDAITWSSVAFSLPTSFTPQVGRDGMAVAFGRTIYLMCATPDGGSCITGIYSQDGGLSWKYSATFPDSVVGVLAANGNQLVYSDGTSIYMTIGAGF
jgi:hypothetical protein